MNYAQSRKRDDADLWDWTVSNDSEIWRIKPCTEECHHTTQEEADRHFYEWCLSLVSDHEITNAQYKCEVCGVWTSHYLGNSQLRMLSFESFLCDIHRNKDELRKLHSFYSPIVIIHS